MAKVFNHKTRILTAQVWDGKSENPVPAIEITPGIASWLEVMQKLSRVFNENTEEYDQLFDPDFVQRVCQIAFEDAVWDKSTVVDHAYKVLYRLIAKQIVKSVISRPEPDALLSAASFQASVEAVMNNNGMSVDEAISVVNQRILIQKIGQLVLELSE